MSQAIDTGTHRQLRILDTPSVGDASKLALVRLLDNRRGGIDGDTREPKSPLRWP